MKTIRLFVAILFTTLVLGRQTSFAQMAMSSSTAKQVTVSGEVLDLSCYMSSQAKGASHQKCASDCLKAGGPMGLLTSDGKVYVLTSNHDHMDAYNTAKQHAAE